MLKVLFNPIGLKIFQYMLEHEHATTNDLAKQLPEVSQASLYRHISKMQNEDLIYVHSEKKIRGVYEKTYKIKNNIIADMNKMVDKESKEELFHICYAFSMSILMNFEKYLKQEDFDLRKDKVGFRTIPMYMSDEECDEFSSEMQELIKKFSSNEADGQRKLRQYYYAFLQST